MQRKLMVLFAVLVMLSLVITPVGIARAQDPQPPQPITTPFNPPYYPPVHDPKDYWDTGKGVIPPASAGIIQNDVQAAVALGQPGLSFRYVQTFGVTGEPYLADGTHLNKPNGLFIDASNNLYTVEENGHRLLKFNSSGVTQ